MNLPRWQIPNEHWANFSCNLTVVKGCGEASIVCWVWCIIPAWKTGSVYVNGVWRPEGHRIHQSPHRKLSLLHAGRVKSIILSPELWGYCDSKARPWSGNRTAETQYFSLFETLSQLRNHSAVRGTKSQMFSLLRTFLSTVPSWEGANLSTYPSEMRSNRSLCRSNAHKIQ